MDAPQTFQQRSHVQGKIEGSLPDESAAAATFWRIAPFLTRLPLIAGVAGFVRLGGGWLLDPARVGVITESGIRLETQAAITHMRGTGALFVPLAAILVFCLTSTRRVLLGLQLLTTIIAGAFLVRCVILLVDGPTALLARILRAELAGLALAAAGLVLETLRRRRGARASAGAKGAR
jgi:hypothetical protein